MTLRSVDDHREHRGSAAFRSSLSRRSSQTRTTRSTGPVRRCARRRQPDATPWSRRRYPDVTCGCSSTARTSAFQADDASSILVARSRKRWNRKVHTASKRVGNSGRFRAAKSESPNATLRWAGSKLPIPPRRNSDLSAVQPRQGTALGNDPHRHPAQAWTVAMTLHSRLSGLACSDRSTIEGDVL